MPQKLNSAGKMQNYVPAGHPAGGEYGDNATGSNKHFTNFKKPKSKSKIKEKFEEKLEINLDAKKYSKEQVLEMLDNIQDESIQKAFDYAIDNFGNNIPKIILQSYGGSFFRREDGLFGLKGIYFDEEDLEREFENKGEPLVHEFTHWITNNMNVKVELERDPKWWWVPKDKKTLTFDMPIGLAPIFNGKSFTDIIKSEAQSLNRKSSVINPLKEKMENNINDAFAKANLNRKEYDNYFGIMRETYFKEIKDYLKNDYQNGEITKSEYMNKLKSKNLIQECINRFPDKKNKFEMISKGFEIESKAKNVFWKENGLVIVSDMLSSNTSSGEKSGFGLGHDSEYFKSKKDGYGLETNGNYSNEFTSEMFSALATGNTNVIETTKKLMPKSYEAFQEILKYYTGDKKV